MGEGVSYQPGTPVAIVGFPAPAYWKTLGCMYGVYRGCPQGHVTSEQRHPPPSGPTVVLVLIA